MCKYLLYSGELELDVKVIQKQSPDFYFFFFKIFLKWVNLTQPNI